jgi:hypothetical protein
MSRKQASDKILRIVEVTIEVVGLVVMIIPLILRRRK